MKARVVLYAVGVLIGVLVLGYVALRWSDGVAHNAQRSSIQKLVDLTVQVKMDEAKQKSDENETLPVDAGTLSKDITALQGDVDNLQSEVNKVCPDASGPARSRKNARVATTSNEDAFGDVRAALTELRTSFQEMEKQETFAAS